METNKKGIALILSIFTLVTLFSLVSLGTYEYISDLSPERYYENNLQVLYDLEAAKTACLWEEDAAGYNWCTTSSTTCRLQGASITGGFYRLAGHNFRAKVYYDNGEISIYAHAFRGSEAQPQYSRYLEYIYAPSPMYQYMMFSNRSLDLGGSQLYDVRGGKIHTNGNLSFYPSSNGVRFNQISELSASGSILYSQWTNYPAPSRIDILDGSVDGMAPAPYLNTPSLASPHLYPTTGEAVIPGPYTYWYTDPKTGVSSLLWKSFGDWVGGDWGIYGRVPFIWRGEESFFYGNQYGAASVSEFTYLSPEGGVVDARYLNKAVIERFYLSGDSLNNTETTEYYKRNVHFRPYQDKSGELNDKWYELPGALPQDYNWSNKYRNRISSEMPVTFYATQACAEGSASCQVDPSPLAGPTGWRYIKRDSVGNICINDACYNDPASVYLKAEDYDESGNKYYNNLSPLEDDKNKEFFADYRYADDVNNPENWKIRAFNSGQQEEGFQDYLSLLSREGIEGVIRSGVEEKEPYLGKLFDDAAGDSPYKTKAQSNGIYIDDIDTVVTQLNTGCAEPVAQKVEFFNWKTDQEVTLIDMDVENMSACNKAPVNGIIYSKVPIRLSNATDLPGVNTEKRAVFTVISEESVYLKGDYNTGGSSPANWKISNIATKKKVYTLSNAFNDPPKTPDFSIYNEYPYVYVKVVKDASGKIIIYLKEEGNPALGDGVWINADSVGAYASITPDTKNWIIKTKDNKQRDYASSGITSPNRVDKAEYSYYSLFITPYDSNNGDNTLENWYYLDTGGREIQAKKYMVGAFIDFYDSSDPQYDDEYYSSLGAEESTWDYRRTSIYYPSNENYLRAYGSGLRNVPSVGLAYDDRFPQVIPQDYEAVLGFTGRNIWRLISEGYFNSC